MPAIHSSAVLERVLAPIGRCLNPEAAKALVDLRTDPELQTRLDELADKNTADELTAEERDEYDFYLSTLSVLSVLQSQARMVLKGMSN